MSGSTTTSIEAAWWIAVAVPSGLLAMFAMFWWTVRHDGQVACPARLERERREALASTVSTIPRRTSPRPEPAGVGAGLRRTA